MTLVFHFCHMSSARGTSDGRGPVTRTRVPDRDEQGKPREDARRGRCHPLEAGIYPCGCHRYRDTRLPSTKYQGGSWSPKRKGGRAPRRTCCRRQNIHPGSAHTSLKPFSRALLGQRARRRLHHAGQAQVAGRRSCVWSPCRWHTRA
jgi:hypothetical protein